MFHAVRYRTSLFNKNISIPSIVTTLPRLIELAGAESRFPENARLDVNKAAATIGLTKFNEMKTFYLETRPDFEEKLLAAYSEQIVELNGHLYDFHFVKGSVEKVDLPLPTEFGRQKFVYLEITLYFLSTGNRVLMGESFSGPALGPGGHRSTRWAPAGTEFLTCVPRPEDSDNLLAYLTIGDMTTANLNTGEVNRTFLENYSLGTTSVLECGDEERLFGAIGK